MTKYLFIIALIISSCHVSFALKMNHKYYSLQTVQDIDESQSILALNKCKTECLQMKEYFPFHFRYQRLIIRQTDGMVKYFIGHCQVKMLKDEYQPWANLKNYIDSTNIFGDNDVLNEGEGSIWKSYNDVCENDKLKLNDQVLQSMKLLRHHSNFYYYDDGSFNNQEPFNDINSMFAQINGSK